ncbi:helix-turn-helix domain-containing protein [Nocardia sp. CWNU-33]|uniref:helix-turn-helix domain-containing protein n=1 Tax=Nocardia sp. CWNU-33 TaxID=3392117 RepID=UPI00398E49A5
MTGEMAGSALPRRLLGRQLRELRERSGVSAVDARKAISVSQQTLWRIESGQSGVKLRPHDVRALCDLYRAADAVTRRLLALAEETKSAGWWHAYSDAIPKEFDLFVGLEEAANRSTGYQSTLLPGLLQTLEYRRALIWVEYPTISTENVERRLEISTRRQTRLTGDTKSLALNVILNEAVLRHDVGGPAVMRAQLKQLANIGGQPNVSIRVVPIDASIHRGLIVGPFTILEFPPHPTTYLTEPPVVYVEGYTGDLYLEKSNEVKQYRQAFADIERSALTEDQSCRLFLNIAEEQGI